MTKITRNVILDLMPLYLAGEASQDTKELVEEYLETDKELAEMAKQSTTFDLPKDVPVPLEKDQALQLYIGQAPDDHSHGDHWSLYRYRATIFRRDGGVFDRCIVANPIVNNSPSDGSGWGVVILPELLSPKI